MSLKEFCNEHGQKKAAEVMRCTQGNISLSLKAKRKIFIEPDSESDAGFTLYIQNNPFTTHNKAINLVKIAFI